MRRTSPTPCQTAPASFRLSLAGLLGLDLPRTATSTFPGCRPFPEGGVWEGGNSLKIQIASGLHVRAKDVCVQFETGYKGPPIASAERSHGTAIGSRTQVLNEACSGVAPKGMPSLRAISLRTNPCGVHQRAYSKP